jgi:hypothetical protein
MTNTDKLNSVKAAAVTVGVTSKQILELRKTVWDFADIQSEIMSTGFFISSDGYVMTAWYGWLGETTICVILFSERIVH